MRGLRDQDQAVITCATSCLEVSTFMYPHTAWQDSFIHNTFENAAATCSGVQAAYEVLRKKGRVDGTYKFIAFGGDGGAYMISGCSLFQRQWKETMTWFMSAMTTAAYMNTGIQRSSATPLYADTTTSPVGKLSKGKPQYRKDLTAIMVEHNIPYVAQTTLFRNMRDIHEKAARAIYTPGAAFLNVMAACPRGWVYETADIMEICRLAVDTCYWPV